MSKYVAFDVKALCRQEIILAALAAIGYGPEKVEVHAQPQALYDYHGLERPEKAHIIIRRQNTGVGSSNDVGLVRQADGTWKAIVSDYDTSALCRKMPGGVRFVDALGTAYRQISQDRAVRKILTKTIPEWKAKGKIPANATVRKVDVSPTVTQYVLAFSA